ncbi:MAG TPA: dienelactone hydrolase family protein [Fimbriiglobus sp.]|jgi:dienelactone hydrolase|nr:dienelactone hydrolase family protein [Fimbriiglobus sp.]
MNPALFLGLLAPLAAVAPAASPVATGEVRCACDDERCGVPEPFRLADHTFPYQQQLRYDLEYSGVEVYTVRFPSPVESPHAANNTVHAEYFRPKGAAGKVPAVVVLDILQGNALVSRGAAMWLAQNGIAALAITMPYYGPRRPTEGRHRMLTTDVEASVANVRQTVLDGRRAVAWLAARPEVDADRIGVVGTSLGSFMGGLLAAAEPRVRSACLLLGGGGLVDAFYQHPKTQWLTVALLAVGVTKEKLQRQIAPVDPLTYADRLKGKKLLLIGASRDDIVPPEAMRRLWEATGKPKIVWLDATHVGAAAHVFTAMNAIIAHLKEK